MSVRGRLHKSSTSKWPRSRVVLRSYQPRSSISTFASPSILQAPVSLQDKPRCSCPASNGVAATQTTAPSQPPSIDAAQTLQQQQRRQAVFVSTNSSQQLQQEQVQQNQQQQSQQSTGGGSSSSGQLQLDAAAVHKPEIVTAAISKARSIAQLEAIVRQHGPFMNHIHVSAAFIQLHRLWPSSSSGSSLGSSNRTGSKDASASTPLALLLQLQQLAQGLQRVDGRYCANLLYSLARLEEFEPAAYSPALLEQVCAASYELANTLPPQELATLVWALAKLNVVPAEQLTKRLVSNTLRKLLGFSSQDLAMTLLALPRLSSDGNTVSPYSTVHKLAAAAAGRLQEASPHECALLLLALATVNYQYPAEWLSSFWAASQAKLQDMGPAEIGMVGWALGRMAPLAAAPPAQWVAGWEHAVTASCFGQEQQEQQQRHHKQHHDYNGSRSSNGRTSSGRAGAISNIAVVELAMAVYGWSTAAVHIPPSQAFQQQLYTVTQQAMESNSSTSITPQQHQQRVDVQQWHQQLHVQEQLSHQHGAQQQQQQQQFMQHVHNKQQQWRHQQGHSILSPRLVVEFLAAAARWQQLPPRAWLLAALQFLQQQLVAGLCSTRDLSNLLWSLASLGTKPTSRWMNAAAGALQHPLVHLLEQQQQQPCKRAKQQRQQQQKQQQRHQDIVQHLPDVQLQPKQLAVALWAFSRLQYNPSSSFWSTFWPASEVVLASQHSSSQCSCLDVAMMLEAVAQLQQQPSKHWVQGALNAAIRTAANVVQDHRRKQAVSQFKQWQQQQQQQHVADQASQQLVWVAFAAARLGARPGHAWCLRLLNTVGQAAPQQLNAQAVCSLVWSLGVLGYRPAGGLLPAWLADLVTAASAAVSCGNEAAAGSDESAAAAAAGAGEALCLPAQCSHSQLGMLLSGLRRCSVALGVGWQQQLLGYTQHQAAELPAEVLVQVVLHVAAAPIQPSSSWKVAIAAALGTAMADWQQKVQQRQEQKQQVLLQQQESQPQNAQQHCEGLEPATGWQHQCQQQQKSLRPQEQHHWQLFGLLAALVKLDMVPSKQLLQHLEQFTVQCAGQLPEQQAAVQAKCLAVLQQRCQQLDGDLMVNAQQDQEWQQQQHQAHASKQQQRSTPETSQPHINGSTASGLEPLSGQSAAPEYGSSVPNTVQQQQQQFQSIRSMNRPYFSRSSNGQTAGGRWADAVWAASSTAGIAGSGSSSGQTCSSQGKQCLQL